MLVITVSYELYEWESTNHGLCSSTQACACVCACLRECVRACVRACVHVSVCVRACVYSEMESC